ncbi:MULTISPECIES: intermembrane transport protein PqiB [unclassified Duganella]|uniref:PqiB family protein n=1 Tax=unclassified Duganella TaxID=2636909 RepID=UPI00088E9A5C|nr:MULTISPECIES: MlaD family protein [unclassified Duganella]SDG64257.1 paraquat-inducible protein B [Duganella sp. OV458]SDJ89277.1 paraquat-inducible protein B [Duganella sp. OV510]
MPENENGNPPLNEPEVEKANRWLPSLVWLIPLLAALIGLTLVTKTLLDQGPTVTVSFRSADGLEPGKTKVKYKDVDIGLVKSISLARDLSKVLVTIDMSKEAKRFTAQDTRFWVVRPRIGASGVSGLNTLLSGSYIGVDAGKSEETTNEFTGLEKPPQVTRDEKGTSYLLHSESLGSIDVGAPIFYRRIQVGQVTGFDLEEKGRGVKMSVFIAAPYDQYVGKNTRWWHASGVDVRLDSSGFKVNTQSLAAVLVGGISFESVSGQKPSAVAPGGSEFALAADQASAMREPDGMAVTTVLYFDQSLRGLSAGAAVDFRGIVLGEVRSVGVEFDPVKKNFRMPVTVDMYPARLGRSFAKSVQDDQERNGALVLERLVARGLRGQLRTGNLLTGQLYVALDFFPNAAPVKIDATAEVVELPTVPNSLDELQTQLSSIARKLDKVPFEEIGKNLRDTLKSADVLMKRLDAQVVPELKDTLAAARKTFSEADLLLQKDSPMQSDLREALRQVTETMESLNALSDYLERHPESLIRGKPEKKGEQK